MAAPRRIEDIMLQKDGKFFVAGHRGLVGSAICRALRRAGYEHLCVRSHAELDLTEQQAVRDFFAAEKPDYVILAAAKVGGIHANATYPAQFIYENLQIQNNVIHSAWQNGVKKFVYASSSSVYGDEPNLPKTEGREGNLLSPYALTKRCDEEWAKLYTMHYGLDTYGMRYFNVFGRRQDPNGAYAAVIPKFILLLMKNEAPTINGDGRQSRDFTYVENVIEANLKACLAPHEAAGEAFNIAYGGREYLIDIYHTLTKALDKDIEPHFGPDRKGDIKHSNADITKARKLLGYDPDYDFASGLNEAIEWYKENL